jgi:non-homologous end joining protein Ku
VVDLMEALRSSLGKAPAKKPAAKAPARRKAS